MYIISNYIYSKFYNRGVGVNYLRSTPYYIQIKELEFKILIICRISKRTQIIWIILYRNLTQVSAKFSYNVMIISRKPCLKQKNNT